MPNKSKTCFCSFYLSFFVKVYTFAPMNVKSVTYSMQTLQRISQFFASFYAIYLVNPNNCVTHTHTQERDQYKSTRDARVIYNIITYKQRVCKKFFINFLHALFHVFLEQKMKEFGISDKKRPKISCNPFIYYSFGQKTF